VIYEKADWLPKHFADKYINNYPEQWIRDYCSNPEVDEHDSSLYGNYSGPAELYDMELCDWIEYTVLPVLKTQMLGNVYNHDHHYVSYHMDEQNSWLEHHNDLKKFRWLITSQVYLNNNQGVIVIEKDGERTIPCKPNYFYAIKASPFSWHYVPEVKEQKNSILFRVGKKNCNTIANPHPTKPAWVIVNDNHCDAHYAKLGLRMGNLTEAWLHHNECYNIYHSNWREDPTRIINKAERKHEVVNVINSGEFINSETITLTDDNINDYAEQMFNFESYDTTWSNLEKVMKNYYDNDCHMNYSDI